MHWMTALYLFSLSGHELFLLSIKQSCMIHYLHCYQPFPSINSSHWFEKWNSTIFCYKDKSNILSILILGKQVIWFLWQIMFQNLSQNIKILPHRQVITFRIWNTLSAVTFETKCKVHQIDFLEYFTKKYQCFILFGQ